MAAADLSELPGWARELLERSPLGHLSYLDDGDHPRVLPVTFAVAGDSLWTAIDQKPKRKPPARVRYLRRRPEAALCTDHYEDDWSRLAWVQAIGSVEVVEVSAGDAERSALDALRAKYRSYLEQPPEGPLIRLRPERVLCWRATED
ncbi:MAG: pyridoxamine 5'-phosphate oxidase family protein [Thermoleophilaceae bacterium]|nr:pyridoxamine 5'-phosphate oxidase family protein [Thermoleophilaceae bacterium]